MTTAELAQCYVPVPLQWQHVQVGDVIVGKAGELYTVESTGGRGTTVALHLHQYEHPFLGKPDDVVNVLVSVPERDALTIARDQLAARVIERRAG